MKKIYPRHLLTYYDALLSKRALFKGKMPFRAMLLFIGFLQLIPSLGKAQNVYSYTYQNVTRNNGGGTLEQGDTIEVRALVRVVDQTDNFFFRDSIDPGTEFIPNSLKVITNEGLIIDDYTDAGDNDRGISFIDGGFNLLRINLGKNTNRARTTNYNSRSPGGEVTPGDIPQFYGNTLFLVAFRVKITANFGDIIHLTSNFFNDTKDIRLEYPGIKIIKNQSLCKDFSSASFTAESDFGSGTVKNRTLEVTAPGYIKYPLSATGPGDGYYSVVNNTSANGTTNDAGPYNPNPARVWGVWDIIGDHTGATDPVAGNPPTPITPSTNGGYMLVVNAAFPTGEVYRDTIKDVCPNTYYEFSAWIRNICGKCAINEESEQTFLPGVQPNLAFTVNDVDYYTTGNIPYEPRGWVKRGFIYKTGPTETSFAITIKNNAPGGGGNDWVIDDIKLATCYPNLIMNPSDTAKVCAGLLTQISDTVKSYYNNYTSYCWEKSLDNGVTWASTGNCGTGVPAIVDGLYQYVVDSVFTPVAADSGVYLRLKVATTSANLNDVNCSVNNSQKVYLKVYSVDCSVLENTAVALDGKLAQNRAVLQWVAQNEQGLKEYHIEKSLDGIHFYTSGIVPALNTIEDAHYKYDDPEPVYGQAYYRIKIVKKNVGYQKFSNSIVLQNSNAPFKMSVINPFKNDLEVDLFVPQQGKVNLLLYDIYGKIVDKKMVQISKGRSKVVFENTGGLMPGVYILRAIHNNTTLQRKLIKAD